MSQSAPHSEIAPRLRAALSGVQDVDDFRCRPCDAVDDNVVRMRNAFTGAGDPSRPEQLRLFGQWQYRLLDQIPNVPCRWRVAFGDVGDNLCQVLARAWAPDQCPHAKRRLIRLRAVLGLGDDSVELGHDGGMWDPGARVGQAGLDPNPEPAFVGFRVLSTLELVLNRRKLAH